MQPYSTNCSSHVFPTHVKRTYPSEEEVYGVPSNDDFNGVINDYLTRLSLKKRDKALIDKERYRMIREVLRNPKDTSVSTAQFRFWVKKMFTFSNDSQKIVHHDEKPVATREEIYNILVDAHRQANHGGRDKTSAIVKYQYSWIPKELIARFVRCCPTCRIRRSGCNFPESPIPPPIKFNYEAIYDTAKSAAAAAAVAGSQMYTPLLTGSLGSTPSPINKPFYSRPLFPNNGFFEDDTFQTKQDDRFMDIFSTYKLNVGPELLNPNDILESIMSGWDQKDIFSQNPQLF